MRRGEYAPDDGLQVPVALELLVDVAGKELIHTLLHGVEALEH